MTFDKVNRISAAKAVTSRTNPSVKRYAALMRSADSRREAGAFVIEGATMLREAIASGAHIESVIFDAEYGLPDGILENLSEDTELISAGRGVMGAFSGLDSPSQIAAVCAFPERGADVRGGMLVLDGVRDPGNMGTILRTAGAFGVPVAILPGCADIYNPKVVRSTMGAIFFTEIIFPESADKLSLMLRDAGVPLLAAVLSPDAADVRNAGLSSAAVVIGNEARGVSAEVVGMCTGKIKIPMSGPAESLNAAVAASIAAWEMKRPCGI